MASAPALISEILDPPHRFLPLHSIIQDSLRYLWLETGGGTGTHSSDYTIALGLVSQENVIPSKFHGATHFCDTFQTLWGILFILVDFLHLLRFSNTMGIRRQWIIPPALSERHTTPCGRLQSKVSSKLQAFFNFNTSLKDLLSL